MRSFVFRSVLLIAIISLFFFAREAAADKVVTIHGQTVEGTITQDTDTHVTIRTTSGADIRLPRSIIREIEQPNVSRSEAEAERAMIRKDYYRALELLQQAKKEGDASENIDEKIANLLVRIEKQEAERYQSEFNDAVSQMLSGKCEAAREGFERLMVRAPANGVFWLKARRGLALTYWHQALLYQDKVENIRALESMREATNADPTLAIAHFDLANLILTYGTDRHGAMKHLDMGLELLDGRFENGNEVYADEIYQDFMPKNTLVNAERYYQERFNRAVLEYKIVDKVSAAQQFLDLLQVEELPDASKSLAIDYIVEAYTDSDVARKMDASEMHKRLDQALELNPMAANAWALKAQIYRRNGQNDEAVSMINKSLEIDPEQPDLYEFRADIYREQERMVESLADLTRATEIEETFGRQIKMGNMLLEGADFEESILHFDRAIEMDSDAMDPVLGRVKANLQMAMVVGASQAKVNVLLSKAEKDIEWVLTKDREMLDAKLQQARLMRLRDNDISAKDILSSIIDQLNPTYEEEGQDMDSDSKRILSHAYTERGNIFIKQNSLNSAESDYSRALKIAESHAEAFEGLGLVAEKRGNHKDARDNYMKAINSEPANPGFELRLALLYHQHLKEYEEALEHYQKFREKGGYESRLESWMQECRNAIEGGASSV